MLTFASSTSARTPRPRARGRGRRQGDGVAIMCRNHRGFVDATLAVSKLGASALYMNTGFAGPQFKDVVEREKPEVLVYDEEFADSWKGPRGRRATGLSRYVGWREDKDASA